MTDQEIIDNLTKKEGQKEENDAIKYILEASEFIGAASKLVRKEMKEIDMVDDLLQEALIIFIKKIRAGRFEQKNAKLSTYFVSICLNLVRNFNRKRDPLNSPYEPSIPEVATGVIDNEGKLILKERLWIVKRNLGRLSAVCQDYLKDATVNKLSYRQIADKYGSTEKSVKSKIYKCRQQLRKMCKNDLEV